jgi:hypothetical protein
MGRSCLPGRLVEQAQELSLQVPAVHVAEVGARIENLPDLLAGQETVGRGG